MTAERMTEAERTAKTRELVRQFAALVADAPPAEPDPEIDTKLQAQASRQARQIALELSLTSETSALEAAGLERLAVDGDGALAESNFAEQPVLLVNRRAHVSALVSHAYSRAVRAREFARALERCDPSELTGGMTEAMAAMMEDVVGLLDALTSHDQIHQAPLYVHGA